VLTVLLKKICIDLRYSGDELLKDYIACLVSSLSHFPATEATCLKNGMPFIHTVFVYVVHICF
jgi:hypothetical protein